MKCEFCDQEIIIKYASGRFCNRVCSNRFSSNKNKEEKNKKIKESLKGIPPKSLLCRDKWIDKHKESVAKRWKDKKTFLKKEKSFEKLPDYIRREIVLEEQNSCCAKCGISEWLGQKIILELEHKDGNHFNDLRENLEFICPNCHSLTKTWRGRNKVREKKDIVSNEQFLEALKNTTTIRQALLLLKLTPSANNYARAKRILQKA